jgi:hypothetical protein
MQSQFIDISIAVTIILAAFELAKYAISRVTGNGLGRIKEEINSLKENHIHQVVDMLNKIDIRTEEMNGKLIQIIELLKLLNGSKK